MLFVCRFVDLFVCFFFHFKWTRGWRTRKHLFIALLLFLTVHKSQEGCNKGGGDVVVVVPGVRGDCFQLCLTRFRGGPMGGICWVARARKASAIRVGCDVTIDLNPVVSITSVACLEKALFILD